MGKRLQILPAVGAGALAGLFLAYPEDTIQAACGACELWAKSVMPGLFPFLLIMLFLTRYLPSAVGRKGAEGKAAGLPPGGGRLVLMGLLSGSPGGARLAQERLCLFTKHSLMCFAAYTGTMSPMFLIGTLGGWIGSHRWGAVMLCAHWLGAMAAGQLVHRLAKGRSGILSSQEPAARKAMGFSELINSAAQAMLTVCGCMILGNVLSALLQRLLPLSSAWAAGMQAAMEVTAGCHRILALGLDPRVAASLMCAAVSFGGISILMQNLAFYRGYVRPLHLMGIRLVHALLSGFICFGLLRLIGGAAPLPAAVTAAAGTGGPFSGEIVMLAAWMAALIPWKKTPGESAK